MTNKTEIHEIHGVVALSKMTSRWRDLSGEVIKTKVTLTITTDDGVDHEIVLFTQNPQDPQWRAK